MAKFRFIHAADLHLDTPFQGLSAADPAVAGVLRDASLEAFGELVKLAIEREAAFVLLSGDIYDGADRGVRAQLEFLRGLERLSSRGIETFIVHGNHDPLSGWSAIRNWPAGVTVFGSREVECREVVRDGATLARVYGISYARQDVSENLARRFSRKPAGGLHVGLLHCNVGNNSQHERYAPCELADLLNAGMDYWALGHVHQRGILNDRPFVVYPGNLQGRSPKPSECGPKGAMLVEADTDGVRDVTFVPLDKARFVQAELDVSAAEDLPGLRRLLEDHAQTIRDENEGRHLVLRLSLTGRPAARADLRREGALDELLNDLRRQYASDRPMLHWESLADRTRMELDMDAIRDRGDFACEVLAFADELSADANALDEFLKKHLRDLSRAVPAAWLKNDDLLDSRAVLQRAKELAMELLQEENS